MRCPLPRCSGSLERRANPDRYVCSSCLRVFAVADAERFARR